MRLHAVLLSAATLSYPLVTFFLLREYGVRALAIPLIALAILRMALKREWLWGALLAGLAAATLLTDQSLPAKFYPVVVNIGLLFVFGHSLYRPPSFVERLARLREPDLPPQAIAYTRQVTLIWCVFFLCNAAVAAWLALMASDAAWAFYSGGLSYVLAGALFGGEFLVRLWRRRSWRDG